MTERLLIISWYVDPNPSTLHEPGYAVATYGEGKARVQLSHGDFPDLDPEELTAEAVAMLRAVAPRRRS